MRIADTPGPNGHALANTPWVIAVGPRPDGLSGIDEKWIVAQGKTDNDGYIPLTSADQEKLSIAYAAHPSNSWIVYPGNTVQLNVETEKPEWDSKAKLLQALNAADFSPDLHQSQLSDGAAAHTRYAKEAFGISASGKLYEKVRE